MYLGASNLYIVALKRLLLYPATLTSLPSYISSQPCRSKQFLFLLFTGNFTA